MQKNIQPIYTLPSQVPMSAATELPATTSSQPKRSKKAKESKRRQVKNACINCQKACKKCDEGRACQRCIKLGIESTCVDSPRKERLRGVKRGPYKKRQPKNVMTEVKPINDQDNIFHFDQDFKWLDNTQVADQQLYHQHQYQQQNEQAFNQIQYTTYQDQSYQPQQPQQESTACFTSDVSIGNYQPYITSYYPSPVSYQQQQQHSSVNSTPSPLTNSFTDQYASSPISSSASSISPVSSTLPLPQDVLQSMLAINDLIPDGMDVPIKQEELDFDNSMMMMPLQETPIFNWSTTSPGASDALTFTSVGTSAPQLTQPVYQQCQQQQQVYIPQQSTHYVPFY